jgi:hypothetical protein
MLTTTSYAANANKLKRVNKNFKISEAENVV